MAPKGEVAVWLADDAARLIVGAQPAPEERGRSRWVTKGFIVDEVGGVGFWLQAHTIRELRPAVRKKPAKHVMWGFKSGQLFIRWDAVLTIQAFESEAKEVGFKSVSAKP